jgi:NADH:ubiquinone oxidoreductase subunit K
VLLVLGIAISVVTFGIGVVGLITKQNFFEC